MKPVVLVGCPIDNCGARVRARGMCNKHYLRDRSRRLGPCIVSGCTRLQHSGGICRMHYHRVSKRGHVGPAGEDRGGRGFGVTSEGYIRIYRPGHPVAQVDGWALEHRVVAYDAGLSGVLDGHVHHLNEDKTDNRLENFEVLTPSEHARLHGFSPEARATRLRFDPKTEKKIERRLMKGESMRQLARSLGCSVVAIRRIRDRAGIPSYRRLRGRR